MSYQSTSSEKFLSTVSEWLNSNGEILVLIRYSRAAGNRSWEFFTSIQEFESRVKELSAETFVGVFQNYEFSLRGTVSEEFIGEALSKFDEMNDCLLICLDKVTMGKQSWFHECNIESIEELEEELRDGGTFCFGKQVAIGSEPNWLNEGEDLICAVVPNEGGIVETGIY